MRICACEQVVRSILRPMRLRFWHPKTSSVEMPLSQRWDIPRVLWKAVSAIRSGGSCSAPRPGLGTTVTERYRTLCPLQRYPPLRVRSHPPRLRRFANLLPHVWKCVSASAVHQCYCFAKLGIEPMDSSVRGSHDVYGRLILGSVTRSFTSSSAAQESRRPAHGWHSIPARAHCPLSR